MLPRLVGLGVRLYAGIFVQLLYIYVQLLPWPRR